MSLQGIHKKYLLTFHEQGTM